MCKAPRGEYAIHPRTLGAEGRHAAFFDLPQVAPQPRQQFASGAVINSLPQFFQCEMDDVVMMDFFRRNLAAEFKPDTVQQINLLGREAGRMRAQIENMFLADQVEDAMGSAETAMRTTEPGGKNSVLGNPVQDPVGSLTQ